MKKREKKLIEPLNLSKQGYYQKYFQENKKNSKKTWEGIHKIISSRKAIKDGSVSAIIIDDITITESTEMAKNFNSFFTSTGTNLQKRFSLLGKGLQIF